MTKRFACELVTFVEPFFVEGLDRTQTAGTYMVEILEELIPNLSFAAYRVVSTSIELPVIGGGLHSGQVVRINSALVSAALRNGEDGDRQLKYLALD
jgi:hypothetical protein